MKSKLHFLQRTFIAKLRSIDPATAPLWGKMNVQQMIEHMSDSVRIANGKDLQTVITPAERLQAMKDFAVSEKEFRPNTKNALMGEHPAEVRLKDTEAAILELETEMRLFVEHFEQNAGSTVANPFFGELNFQEWISLLYKHAVHHLKQFGIEV
ncbi:MAG TPA: DUF1569 domain-containing protein [Bacteroidia bacterium]|nr:DUF1569 domain-containing protein [Bacteroidia bacterium]